MESTIVSAIFPYMATIICLMVTGLYFLYGVCASLRVISIELTSIRKHIYSFDAADLHVIRQCMDSVDMELYRLQRERSRIKEENDNPFFTPRAE